MAVVRRIGHCASVVEGRETSLIVRGDQEDHGRMAAEEQVYVAVADVVAYVESQPVVFGDGAQIFCAAFFGRKHSDRRFVRIVGKDTYYQIAVRVKTGVIGSPGPVRGLVDATVFVKLAYLLPVLDHEKAVETRSDVADRRIIRVLYHKGRRENVVVAVALGRSRSG